jgi:hypothetical protein
MVHELIEIGELAKRQALDHLAQLAWSPIILSGRKQRRLACRVVHTIQILLPIVGVEAYANTSKKLT